MLERVAAETPQLAYELRDLMVVHPVRTPEGSPLVPRSSATCSRSSAGPRRRSPARAPTITNTSTGSPDPQLRRLRTRHPRPRPPAG